MQHIGVINNPDSGGIACDVQQHSIDFVNFLNFRSVPNHPNYYLGCDTTLGCGCATSYNQYTMDASKFVIYPNPNNGNFSIGYKAIATSAVLKIFDVNGREVYKQNLPPWSNEQSVSCKNMVDGIYLARIESDVSSISKPIILLK
ncbi:MAG: T9SS type A sorting domain-containing protein [Bacteroidetes bacterium]|nr:T9SS type A sorting domain-containing protein [Bacteroidota bacterium]